MNDTPKVNPWLKNTAVSLSIILLAMSCYLVLQAILLVNRIEKSFTEISSEVQRTTEAVANLSEKISSVRTDMKGIEKKIKEMIPLEAAEHAIDAAIQIGRNIKEDDIEPDQAAEEEIKFLLSRIKQKDLSYEISGKKRSPSYIHAKMYAKYKLYKKSVASAEDFIEKAAAKTTLGRTYYVINAEGKKHELSEWLSEKLQKYRTDQGNK
ncbi:MAG: DUF5329 domain-containing protein [Desulfobacteraceae bacterium]|nr:DUF5329 domain-containing protein [Desulfobacteraceae bacterium]